MQFDSGWMVDSFDANWVIAVGFLLWSLTTAATGLVRGFTMLLAMRSMLGVGESVIIPACSKIPGFHLPEHHRGFANGVLQGAWSSGPAVGTLGAGLLIARYGWRPVFIVNPQKVVPHKSLNRPHRADPAAAAVLFSDSAQKAAPALDPKEVVLHNFVGPPHGSYPALGDIRDLEGNLYGAASGGGAFGQWGRL